jgi:hypothetical protein
VRLVAARGAAPAATAGDPGGRIDLGLELELAPGWHVYWKNSGDAGYPPRLDFSRTPALAGAELLYPAPRRYDLPGGLVSFGYEQHVIYPIAPTSPISARLAAAGGERLPPVLARLDYLVCRAECIPHTAELSLDLDAAREGTGPEGAATAARLAAAWEPTQTRSVAGAPGECPAEPGPASSLVLVFWPPGIVAPPAPTSFRGASVLRPRAARAFDLRGRTPLPGALPAARRDQADAGDDPLRLDADRARARALGF